MLKINDPRVLNLKNRFNQQSYLKSMMNFGISAKYVSRLYLSPDHGEKINARTNSAKTASKLNSKKAMLARFAKLKICSFVARYH